jgi:hypothetical protein
VLGGDCVWGDELRDASVQFCVREFVEFTRVVDKDNHNHLRDCLKYLVPS